MSQKEDCNDTFRSTLLFGFVQIINVAAKAIINKVAAVVLGPSGVGLIGMLTSTSGLLKTVASLGVSQSVVKDISEAKAKGDLKEYSEIVRLTNKLLLFTSTLGFVIACLIIPFRDGFSDGILDAEGFLFLAVAVAFIIFWEGQLAILKGTRALQYLAKANIIAACLALVTSCTIYIVFKDDGILAVLVLTPLIALLVSSYYVKKLEVDKDAKRNVNWEKSRPIVKTGIALSFATILSQLTVFVTSLYIVEHSSLTVLGYYNVGILMMVGYFSVVINAITTDYYPRISAIASDNNAIENELNKQSMVSLVICLPIFVSFIFALPFALPMLFSDEFIIAIEFIQIGVFGTLLTILSNQFDLIIVVKRDTKVFIACAIALRAVELICNITMFNYFGLVGLGWSIVITSFLHFSLMMFVVKKLYGITYNGLIARILMFVVIYIAASTVVSMILTDVTKWYAGGGLVLSAIFMSNSFSRRVLGLNLRSILRG